MQGEQYSAAKERLETEMVNGEVRKGLLSKARNYTVAALAAVTGIGAAASPGLASDVESPEMGDEDPVVIQEEIEHATGTYDVTVVLDYLEEGEKRAEGESQLEDYSMYIERSNDDARYADLEIHDLNGNRSILRGLAAGQLENSDVLDINRADYMRYQQDPEAFAQFVKDIWNETAATREDITEA